MYNMLMLGPRRNSHSTAEVDSCIDQGGLQCHRAADISTTARDCFIAVVGREKKTVRVKGVAHCFHTDNSIKQYIKSITIILI